MTERKARPEPIEEPESLERKLERAAGDDVDSELRVSLAVAGGAPSQRYRFRFAADGAGHVLCELRCERSGREGRADRSTVDRRQFAGLVAAIVKSGVLEAPAESPRFLPDTVVGVLELSDGRSSVRWHFAADREQAKTQGAVPPPAVERAAEEVYSFAGKLMGRRPASVRP